MTGLSELGHRDWRLVCWRGFGGYLRVRNKFPDLSKPADFGQMNLLNSMVMPMPRHNPADKLKTPDHIPEEYRDRLHSADVVRVYDDPATLDFDGVEKGSYFLKSNHGSQQVQHVDLNEGADPFDAPLLREKAARWVAEPYGVTSSQWWYRPIERKVFLERDLRELASGVDDAPLEDLRFHVINGKVALLQLDVGLGTDERDNPIYDRDLNYIPEPFLRANRREAPLPANVELARDIAEACARDHQYVRVDFYSTGDALFLGKLTFLPNAGRRRVKSKKLNEYLCGF